MKLFLPSLKRVVVVTLLLFVTLQGFLGHLSFSVSIGNGAIVRSPASKLNQVLKSDTSNTY